MLTEEEESRLREEKIAKQLQEYKEKYAEKLTLAFSEYEKNYKANSKLTDNLDGEINFKWESALRLKAMFDIEEHLKEEGKTEIVDIMNKMFLLRGLEKHELPPYHLLPK